jgi:aspartate-semialdehyde dehydrogenase
LLGGETLLGRELNDVLKSRETGALVTPYAASGEGNFGEQDGEAIFVRPLEADSVRDDQAILIAGSPEGASRAYHLAKAGGGHPILIDCSAHLEHQPEARIVGGISADPDLQNSWLLVIAHPAAMALALVLARLARYRRISNSIAHVFEPASERGKRGVTELHQQTTSLLSFKALDKNVFDAQLGFNLLSQYGEEAPVHLSAIEQRIERHVATLLNTGDRATPIPMPSLRLIQAPVFHGYSMSLWVEFASGIDAAELGEALASAQIEVRGPHDEAPDSVGVATQSGLIAGDIRLDRNHPRAAWLWIVGDNLRLTADAAADVVTALEGKPS